MTRDGAACEETKDSGEHDARRFETVGRALGRAIREMLVLSLIHI